METEYRDYRARWGVLFTVFCLNLANNALWISFSSVSSISAAYYETTVGAIDWLGTIGFISGIPICLLSTWIVEHYGLRSALFLGSFWTFLGGLIRALSSFPGLGDRIDVELQYWICIVGQALTGMGNPVAVSVPTKVSQHWFKEKERTFATIALAMSLPLGIVFGQGITPLFVKDPSDIPTMNWVWFIPAALTMILCSVAVRSSKPPTPPSRSAEVKQEVLPYITRMKLLLTNRNYVAINFAIGGAVGFFNCLATQLQQILCSRGYNNEYSGLVGSLLLGAGFLGSIFTGLIVQKTGKMEEVAKICFCIASLDSILVSEFMRKADQSVMIALCCAIFGIFGFGMYPIGLELSVENTYPVDEAAGTALIFLSGQIQGSILIMISGAMEQELSPEIVANSECPEDAKDHTNFLLFMAGYTTLLTLAFVIGLNTVYKRTKANRTQSLEAKQSPS